MTQKTLVTGAAGFIGSHLCEALLSSGAEVIGLDAFTENYSRKDKEANISAIQKHPQAANFKLVTADLLHTDLDRLLAEVREVYHLAGEPGVRASWENGFSRYVERNILATQKLLEKCRAQKMLKKLVFASSSSVYGNRVNHPCAEDERCEPFSPYGVTKLAAEKLCLAYAANFQIPVVCVRYFTVFGPRQRPDMAFYRFCQAALKGSEIQIFGDGEQSRDFTYVDDAVVATLLAAAKGRAGEIYNVGGGCLASVNEVLEIIRELAAVKKLKTVHVENAKGDVRQTRSDSQKARQELQFQPQSDLRQGLARELEWVGKKA